MKWILERLREPSTFAGLSGVAIALGMTAEEYTVWTTAIAGIAGLIAMVLHDKQAAP